MLIQETKTFASESDRWYCPKTQTSVNDCLAKNGSLKKVTLREARKENYIPSVTTILHNLSKPALEKWKIRQYLGMAHRSRGLYWDEDEWIKEVIRTADEEMDVARDRGTEVHGLIDRWLAKGMVVNDIQDAYFPYVQAARTALDRLGVLGEPYEVERTFTVKIDDVWVAGKCDLHYPGVKKLVDWKSSKDPCDGKERLGFDEHVIQCACYSMALFGKFVSCQNCFLSTSNPGNYQLVPWEEEELERGWELYRAAYRLWTLSKQYLVTPLAPLPSE